MRTATALFALGLMGFGLSACDAVLNAPSPASRDTALTDAYEPSEASLGLMQYYQRVEDNLTSLDLLRVDGGGLDTPFNKRQLVQNFVQIAVYNEISLVNGRYQNVRSEGRVQRWVDPVRISMEFGASVPAQTRQQDTRFVSAFARRLSRVSGHPISQTRSGGNFHVAVLDTDEIAAFGPRLKELIPIQDDNLIRQIIDMSPPTYCAVYTFWDRDKPNVFNTAIAIIRAEHPDRLRKLCFHEEIAQGLGLINDSPAARPSIFNDDNEFALLTSHDELLLKMLYDPRLPLGGTPAETRPVIEVLAAEQLGGGN